jgi:hypothetical protein
MSTAEPYYKADHLFLLVGENPLPNYIAAKMLLKEGGTIYLVHSTDTASKADCIGRMLEPINVVFISLGRNEAKSNFIQNEIQGRIKKILEEHPDHTFGLNYTGGTKAMSVHGYRALFEASGVENRRFSYLDARSLQMLIDRNNDSPKPEPVTVKVSLKEIFNLHDLRWQEKEGQKPITEPKMPELATELAKLHIDKNLVFAWHWWCTNVLHPATRKSKKKPHKSPDWKSDTELEKVVLPLQPHSAIQKLNEALLESLKPSEEGKTLLELFQEDNFKRLNELCSFYNALWLQDYVPYLGKVGKLLEKYLEASQTELSLKKAAKHGGFEKAKHVCEWLKGNWLEHYVLQQIQEVSKINLDLINDMGLSFKVRDKAKEDEDQDKFEFDVAFMGGYQLFAISCTTDDTPTLCKSKLFEAYIRARQLGGEQARVALVCCYNNPKKLEVELKVETEVDKEDPKIVVFGPQHLDNLQVHIKSWIDNNNRYYLP